MRSTRTAGLGNEVDGRSATSLSPRERQVALLLTEGVVVREIAHRLQVSPRTVDGHLRSIYHKLGVRGRQGVESLLAGSSGARHAGSVRDSALPNELSSLVGRENQVQRVVRLAESRRLITLIGCGGVGKTRLALRAARQLESRLALDAHLAELSLVSEDDVVDESVMYSLGLRRDSDRAPRDAVADRLGSRPALLVLDSCEHVIEAAASLVAHLLARCGQLRVLATSRQPLLIDGENLEPVHPLELPEADEPLDPDALDTYPALSLFVERARGAGGLTSIGPGDAELVARICRRLDGLPLAIELAAARTRTTSLRSLLAMLDGQERFQVLTDGYRGTATRHRTLMGAVEWSYRLLSEAERELFDRLSVFAGSFDAAAARQVGGLDQEPAGAAAQLTAGLVDRSLMVAMPGPDGEVRYRMLETLRAFGRERLAQSGGSERARQAHARYYARTLGLATGPELSWWTPAKTLELRGQMEDRLAAVDWCSANQPVLVTMITRRLVGFWGRQGPLEEGRQLLERVQARLPAGSSHRAVALANAAWLAQRQGSFDAAEAYAAESLRIRREIGDLPDIADGMARLGDVARHRGDLATAIGLIEAAVSAERSCATEYDVAIDLMYLGNAEGRAGRLDAARAHLEEALGRFTSIDETSGAAYCHGWLGELALIEGHREAARRLLATAMDSFRGLHDRWEVAILLDLFGWLAVMEGEPRRTLRLAGSAAAIRESIGARQPPSLASAVAPGLAIARRALGSGAARASHEGARARPEHAIAYALRESELETDDRAAERAGSASGLTAREREVAAMIAGGLTNRQIGSQLRISVRTAEYHVEQVRTKLGYRSRAQVAAWAAQAGLSNGDGKAGK